MTHNEVINGLKCCNSSKDLCFKCPYIKFGDNCSIKLRKEALKLIKKQKKQLDDKCDRCFAKERVGAE